MSWATVVTYDDQVHVVPWDDVADTIALDHRPDGICPSCIPTAEREAPLDEPILNHHEPSWPGSDERLS